tara:strand:- start:571 stop:1611 length:1041 start_codon:yes stop_codon:yes gene_type:complete
MPSHYNKKRKKEFVQDEYQDEDMHEDMHDEEEREDEESSVDAGGTEGMMVGAAQDFAAGEQRGSFDTSGRGVFAAGTEVIPDDAYIRNQQSIAGFGAMAPRMESSEAESCLNALFEGQDLSDEFKHRAATIFEAAFNEKISEFAENIDSVYREQTEQITENLVSGFASKLDDYLSYVVEEWMQENELAVERGIKTDIAESFIGGLKNLFEAHYVSVPDERYDVLDDLFEANETLQNELNEQIQTNITLNSEIGSYQKSQLFEHHAQDLAATDKERFASLAESVSYVDAQDFNNKLHEIKESYFQNQSIPAALPPQQLLEETTNQQISTGTPMDAYVNTISHQNRIK